MGIYVRVDVPIPEDLLCFTAEQANSTIALNQTGTPTSVNLETSTNGADWSDYTIGTTITLENIGDKVYMRNKSETPTGFSTGGGSYYSFGGSGLIAASGDVGYLLCKDSTDTLVGDYCFLCLFYNFDSLTTPPSLPATTLTERCYAQMFNYCDGLNGLPLLPATSIPNRAYNYMFEGCTSIKLSTTQTGDYTQEYIIPSEGTGTTATSWAAGMFDKTGGTFQSTPSVNTTYYLDKDNLII